MSAGERRHYVTLFDVSQTADGDGGYTETATPLSPPDGWASIQPATQRQLERLMANAVQSVATHIVTLPYHAGLTTRSRIVFGSRTFAVTGVANPEERNLESVCVCAEVV